jgi:hypothetical protein
MKKDEATKGESFNKGGESIILSPNYDITPPPLYYINVTILGDII